MVNYGYLSGEKSHGALSSGIASSLGASFALAYIAASFDGLLATKHQLTWYREMVDALSSRGRTDLASVINQVCAHFERHLNH